MVIYSATSNPNNSVFHLTNCPVIGQIKPDNRRQFETPEMARNAGLRMCNICSPLGQRFRKELPEIKQYAQSHGIEYILFDNTLQITSRHGEWKIVVDGRRNHPFLYHKNQRASKFSDMAAVPGYHAQAIRSKNILGYMEYIASHDTYWETERIKKCEADRIFREQEREKKKLAKRAYREQYAPKSENYTKKQAELRQNTRQLQRGTKNQHFNANQLYSVLNIKRKNYD